MDDTHPFVESTLVPDGTPRSTHGGRAGWFRVACGFSALAAFALGYQSFSTARPSANTSVLYPPSLAGALAVGALLLATASVLASRHRPLQASSFC